MHHAPICIVDTIEVPPDRQAELLALFEEMIVPVLSDAGVKLVSCLSTSADFGESVLVQATWGVPDHGSWNRARKTLFLDPRWHAMWEQVARLRTGGTRRFFYPVDQIAVR
jgi:hypothetical protein